MSKTLAQSLLATPVDHSRGSENLILDKKARKDIARLITGADLMGLIAMGAPGDEYQEEIGTILEKLTEWCIPSFGTEFEWSYQVIYEVVVDDVFSYYFGDAWRDVPCHEIAKLATSICSRLGIAA